MRFALVVKACFFTVMFLIHLTGQSNSEEKFKIATCQFPVSGKLISNAEHIKCLIEEAALNEADLVHFSEAALSGYPPMDIPSFQNFNWDELRAETYEVMSLAKKHAIWVVLGSAHYISEDEKPLKYYFTLSST